MCFFDMAQIKKLVDSARERASNILSSHEAEPNLRHRRKQTLSMAQIKKLVDSARERASNILSSHEAELHLLAKTLLDKETLSGTQACSSCSLTNSLNVQASW